MTLRTIGDLRQYLDSTGLSPERFSSLCGISNMTIRRWLKLENQEALPKKYWPIFDYAFADDTSKASENSTDPHFNFGDGFEGLEEHVTGMGKAAPDAETLKKDYQEKVQDKHIGQGLLDKVRSLFHLLTSEKVTVQQRTLVLGAIVYFLSPVDFIPDTTPMMGYVDDYAVVNMVLASMGSIVVREKSNF